MRIRGNAESMCSSRSSVGRRFCIGLLLALTAVTAPAQPLVLRNLSPLYANLGVPVMAAAQIDAVGRWRSSLQLQLASHTRREQDSENLLELDGETRRVDLGLSYSPGERLRLSLNLPWINHAGGHLDALIDGWHDVFGLPDGPRDDQPEDRLRFAYSGSGGEWLLDSGHSSLGDVEFAADWSLLSGPRTAVSAFTSVKLPSGEEEKFAGSGETALAAGLRFSQADCVFNRVSCHAQLGAVDMGDSSLDSRAESWAPFYGLSVVWVLGDRLSLLAQLEGQGEIYRSAPLDDAGAPVFGALGARWEAAQDWQIEALFSEDLNVGSAPDISFQLGISHVW